MAYSALGALTITTDEPTRDKNVLNCQGNNCIVQWANATVLNRHYANESWTGFTSANQSFVTSLPIDHSRKGRIFKDLTVSSKQWLVIPYVSGQNLETQVLEMTGSNPTTNDFGQVHANAIPLDETYFKMFPMRSGVALVSSLVNGAFRLRGFSYTGAGYSTIDVDTSSTPTSANYPDVFSPTTVFSADLTTIYTGQVDSGLRAHYIDMDVIGDQIEFSTLINTTGGLPSDVTATYSSSVVETLDGKVVALLHSNATSPSVTFTNDDPGSFSSKSYVLSDTSLPIVSRGTGMYFYSSEQSFFQIPQSSYIGTVDLATLSLTINATDFTGTQKTPVTINGDAVNLGIKTESNNVSGITLGDNAFGRGTDLDNLASPVIFLGRIRNTSISSQFWTASAGSGGTQTFTKYVLTEAPPVPTQLDFSGFTYSSGSFYRVGSISANPATFAGHAILDADPASSFAQAPGTYTLANGSRFTFELARGNVTFFSDGGDVALNLPDSGENVALQFSADDSNWTTIGSVVTPAASSNTDYTSYTRTFTGSGGDYYIRFFHNASSSATDKDYAIKNFILSR